MFDPVQRDATVVHRLSLGGTMDMVCLACPPGLLSVCLSVFKLATQAAQYCCTNRVYVTSKAASGAAGCGVGETSIACVSRYLAVKAELSRGQVEASGFERWFGERGQRAASFPLAIRAPRLLLP